MGDDGFELSAVRRSKGIPFVRLKAHILSHRAVVFRDFTYFASGLNFFNLSRSKSFLKVLRKAKPIIKRGNKLIIR